MSLIKQTDEQGFRARGDRRFLQGQVVDIDPVTRLAIVDVGAYDAQGNKTYLHNVPYQPQNPPNRGDTVSLLYGNVSPQSVSLGGAQLGGGNGGNGPQVAGAVTSLAAQGQPALQGAVTLSAGAGVALAQSGQNIQVAAVAGLTSPLTTKGDLWGWNTANARVPVGSDGQALLADSTQPLGVRWGAVPAPGSQAPQWYKYTHSYADFSAASTQTSITLFSLPAGGVIQAVRIHPTTQFVGGPPPYNVGVGVTGNLTKYGANYDCTAPVSNTAQGFTASPGTENAGAAVNVLVTATLSSGLLNAGWTAGSVDIFVLWGAAA